MKVNITFKHPDAVDSSLNCLGVPTKEAAKVRKILSKYVEYDEYIFLEVDTEKETVKLQTV